jgi:hypothetical protein
MKPPRLRETVGQFHQISPPGADLFHLLALLHMVVLDAEVADQPCHRPANVRGTRVHVRIVRDLIEARERHRDALHEVPGAFAREAGAPKLDLRELLNPRRPRVALVAEDALVAALVVGAVDGRR